MDGQNNKKGSGFSNMGLCTMPTCQNINIDRIFSTAPAPFCLTVFIQALQAGRRVVPVMFTLLTHTVNVPYHGGGRMK
jgi:hypothetical protein